MDLYSSIQVFFKNKRVDIPVINTSNLFKVLNFQKKLTESELSSHRDLKTWKMERDDAPIFRYLYRHFQPQRHIEFGTWQGSGAVYCLSETDATVWTINLPFGEKTREGEDAYGYYPDELKALNRWASKVGFGDNESYKTDSIGFIGRNYIDQGFGHRVNQIYCDTRDWDTRQYPSGFFDSALVDGGHLKEVVANDTRKAFSVLRPGGLLMWHDFCPPIWKDFDVTQGVMTAILDEWDWISAQTSHLFWIEPSWILVGIKQY